MSLHDAFGLVAFLTGIFLVIGSYAWLSTPKAAAEQESQRSQAIIDAGNPGGVRATEYWANAYFLKTRRNFLRIMLGAGAIFVVSVAGFSFV